MFVIKNLIDVPHYNNSVGGIDITLDLVYGHHKILVNMIKAKKGLLETKNINYFILKTALKFRRRVIQCV